jgi:hypothetical protein
MPVRLIFLWSDDSTVCCFDGQIQQTGRLMECFVIVMNGLDASRDDRITAMVIG